MDRAVLMALLVALLVTCSVAGTAIGAAPALPSTRSPGPVEPSPPAQFDDELPPVEMLGLESPTRSDVTTQGVDVSTAVETQRTAARAAVDRRALVVAFENAEDEQDRRELLFEAATDVEIAISALRSQQRDVRDDYVNGTMSPDAYARSRTMADVRTEQLQRDLELIQRYADRVPQLSMRSRLEALRVALTGVDGPVTERIRATAIGEEPAVETYIAVSPNGRVLSVVSDDNYVREAYRSDVWTPDTTSGIGFAQAEDRTKDLYPVAFNSSRNLRATMGEHGAGTYQITLVIREGDVVTYLDGDTQNVFFEVQQFRLDGIDPGPAVADSDNGTRLIVNRTHAGGPLRIATLDNTTGAPIDVPVLVGESGYSTGSDGVVWALAPGSQTPVVALGETGNATVTFVPTPQTLVNVSSIQSESTGKIEVTPRERSDEGADGSDEGADRSEP